MPHLHPFQDSFWAPTASNDYNIGYSVLHSKLKQSTAENKVIVDYIKQRINAEKNHATLLASIVAPTTPFESDVGGALKKCFEVVCAESQDSAKEHTSRANDLNTTTLDPLVQFFNRYDRIITQAKKTVESQINQFDVACKLMEEAKLFYVNRCKTLLAVQPDYTDVKMGKALQFPTRDHAWVWFTDLFKEEEYTKEQLQDLLKDMVSDEEIVIKSLLDIQFLKLEDNKYIKQQSLIASDETDNTVVSESKGFSGFLGRWGGQQQAKKEDMLFDMMEADKAYQRSVTQAELLRTQTEQVLYVHYEEMESLELERIQTIKQAFISMAASLSNTIPRCKETFDNMMLYQETLKPDKDVQFIVEQYRTGQYCPKPILYENYFHSVAADQLFGVSLEEIARVQGTMVPRLITVGLSVIESGFSKLYDEEKNVVWTASLPLDRVHAARAEINTSKPITCESLQKFDLLLLASLLRLYLLELPECLFTFELYEPCKLLYSNQNQDTDSRLMSISKLLATLPTANYHTAMALLGHFHKLVKQITTDTQFTSSSLAKSFSYILMRPHTESKISIHEKHPQRLLYDLIENFDAIFTQESHYAQEKNSSRPSIIIPKEKEAADPIAKKKSNSLDESSSNNSSSASPSARTSTSSYNVTRRSSILSSFMRSSQSTPTSAMKSKPPLIIPMPSSSTLFEDPDEIERSSESTVVTTPPHTTSSSIEPHHKSVQLDDSYMMEELASLDSFFEDED
ncbi:G4 quadruplex nucleic acid binding protein [Mucor velutinosus]|uniref:G4 quadruplex nucleic acid binding protein n=1 Tax=Mucor velutinosus TaxID=708070 RepID=A0AAN7DH71_9FUNG|nr:G4 quadruplex nucleic acid binding protein [Mucor velutinosus]